MSDDKPDNVPEPPLMPVPPPQPTPEQINEETLAEILSGDIASLNKTQRNQFLWRLAKGLGLNPLTKPFDLIILNNKLTVYANRTASDQLRRNNNISHEIVYQGPLKVGDTLRDDVYSVQIMMSQPIEGSETPRVEYAIGCVGIANLTGEALGNAIMKCHTKALRRGTLAMCGLGFLDEIEVQSIADVARSTGRPGPRRVLPPADVTASSQPADNSDPEQGVNGPVTVVLPPSKPPVQP
jgi:hypothetical protein